MHGPQKSQKDDHPVHQHIKITSDKKNKKKGDPSIMLTQKFPAEFSYLLDYTDIIASQGKLVMS